MDYRPYILAGTFFLFIVAIVTFVATLVRSRRERPTPHERLVPDIAYSSAVGGGEVDTDLQGLELTVDAGAPSASLLTPLRTGEWMPPDTPARVEDLPDVSLAGRVAEFVPAPAVPEPHFNIEAYQPWEVATPADVGPDAADRTEAADVTVSEPPARPAAVPVGRVVEAPAHDDTFGEEIRALLPTTEFAAVSPASPVATAPEVVEPIASEGAVAVPVAEPVAQSVSLEEQLAALAALTAEEPSAAPVREQAEAEAEPQTATVLLPELELAMPAQEAPPAQELPAPPPSHEFVELAAEPEVPDEAREFVELAAEPEGPDEAHEWVDMLRETQGTAAPARPQAIAAPPAPRPAVTVATAEPPVQEAAPPAEAVASRRRARPAVRVHGMPELAESEGRVAAGRLAPPPIAAGSREAAEEIVMAAPVEMWFGDARVGVKAGTATYERFMKYATVLLDDLKALKQAAR